MNLIVVKPGLITIGDRKTLRDAGVVVIETDKPEEIKVIEPNRSTLRDAISAVMWKCVMTLEKEGKYSGQSLQSWMLRLLVEQSKEEAEEP